MARTGELVVAFAIVIGLVIGGFYVSDMLDYDFSYPVYYELNGGEVSDPLPSSYTSGEYLDLPSAYADGYFFAGWFLDEDLKTKFTGNTYRMSGPLTLYAAYALDLSGRSITFEKTGYIDENFLSYDITGTSVQTFLYYSEEMGSYYMRNHDTTTYIYKDLGYESYTEESTSSDWGRSEDTEKSEPVKETIMTVDGEKECTKVIYTSKNGVTSTHWMYGWITYKMVTEYRSPSNPSIGFSITYSYLSHSYFEVEKECVIDTYASPGISVSGNQGTYMQGDKAVLKATAEGTGFAGWYDENMLLLSSNPEYRFIVGASMTIFAVNTEEYDKTLASDAGIDMDSEFGIKDGRYSVIYWDTGDSSTAEGTFVFPEGGMYRVIADGSDGERSFFVVKATGVADRKYTWTYNRVTYTVSLGIDYDDYVYAHDLYPESKRCNMQSRNYEHETSFVRLSYEDPVMGKYMDQLTDSLIAEFTKRNIRVTEASLNGYILSFVQSFEYQSDQVVKDVDEYWKFPLETLYERGGDCEDTAILLCALAHECRDKMGMGYRTALILMPEHMAGAIMLSDSSSWTYCETTSSAYRMGEIPEKMRSYTEDKSKYEIIEVP